MRRVAAGAARSKATNATTTPQKLADFPAGATGVNCQLLAFMTVIATSTYGRPVVEVRYSTTGDTTYAGQTLCAVGCGRLLYNDAQTIVAMPATASPGAMQDGIQGSASLDAHRKSIIAYGGDHQGPIGRNSDLIIAGIIRSDGGLCTFHHDRGPGDSLPVLIKHPALDMDGILRHQGRKDQKSRQGAKCQCPETDTGKM